MLLKLHKVKKSFKNFGVTTDVVSGASISVDKGEIVAIAGASGCGKTTLLNIIGGLTRPDSGTIFFNDEDITQISDRKYSSLRRKEFGYIFQTFKLIASESVMSNITLPARLDGTFDSVAADRARESMERLGILNLEKNRCALLSGGQKQRVAIARALINNPSMILADEPTANLDAATAKGIFSIIEEMKKNGKGIILVTHDEKMLKKADKCFFMSDGIIKRMKSR